MTYYPARRASALQLPVAVGGEPQTMANSPGQVHSLWPALSHNAVCPVPTSHTSCMTAESLCYSRSGEATFGEQRLEGDPGDAVLFLVLGAGYAGVLSF